MDHVLKERVAIPVDNGLLTMMEPEEVEMLYLLRTLHLETRCMET